MVPLKCEASVPSFGRCGLENLSSKCLIWNYNEMGLNAYMKVRALNIFIVYWQQWLLLVLFIILRIFISYIQCVYFDFVVWGITGERIGFFKARTTVYRALRKTKWFCLQDKHLQNTSPRIYLPRLFGQIVTKTMDPEVESPVQTVFSVIYLQQIFYYCHFYV